MGTITRFLLATGTGSALYTLAIAFSDSIDFFAPDFYTMLGFAAFVLWIFDYFTYFMAT